MSAPIINQIVLHSTNAILKNELAKNSPAFIRSSNGFAKVLALDSSVDHSSVMDMYQSILLDNGFDDLKFNAPLLAPEYIQKIDDAEYISTSYWDKAYKDNYKVVALRAPMGVGKTFSLKEWLKTLVAENSLVNILIIAGRVTNVENYDTQEYADMGFINQHGRNPAKLHKDMHAVRYVGVINSLPKLVDSTNIFNKKGKLIVIFDEFETILGQNFGDANNTDKTTPVLVDLMNRADFQVIADAFLSDGALNMFLSAIPNLVNDYVMKNSIKLKKWQDVKVNLIEDFPSYSSKVRMTFNSIFRGLIEGDSRGCMMYFNLKENLVRFMDLIENQLKPQDRNTDLKGVIGGTSIISQALKEELSEAKAVFKILFYYSETPLSGKGKQVGRIITADFANGKISSKNLNSSKMQSFKRYPNEFILDNGISVLAHSPILEAGISLDKLHHFESVIAWIKPSQGSSGGDGGTQALGRARNAIEMSIFFEPLKDLKELRDYPLFPIKSHADNMQEIICNGNFAKEIIGRKLLDTLKQNPVVLDMYSRYLTHSDKLHALYIPKMVYELSEMIGGFDKINIYKAVSSVLGINMSKKSVDATIERICSKVETLYTKEQVDEIKANINFNFDRNCTLSWFDRDVYAASLLVSMVSTSDNYNDWIRYGLDDNGHPLIATWQEIRDMDGGRKAIELITDLHCLRSVKYCRDNNVTINEIAGLREQLGVFSALKAISIQSDSIYLKSQMQGTIAHTLKYIRDSAAIDWLVPKLGIEKVPSYSTIIFEIDNKLKRSESSDNQDPVTFTSADIKPLATSFKCDPEKVTMVFNSTLERLGYEVVLENRPKEKREHKPRVYKIGMNPLIHKYGIHYSKQPELVKSAKEAGKSYNKLLESLKIVE